MQMLGEIATLTDRGFGFILAQDGQRVFFHKTALFGGLRFEDLREGLAVTLTILNHERGPRASKVQLAESEAPRFDPTEGLIAK